MMHLGDCLDILPMLDENSIDAVVTDPPYGLNFMNKKWDHSVPSVAIWKEVFRVLKPGAHVLAFFGTRTYHRGVVNIEDAGFEIRDQVQWLYGSGFPKSLDVSKAIDKQLGEENNRSAEFDGWGTALKPAHEPIVLARKPLVGTVADNVLGFGVGALHVGACRIGDEVRHAAFTSLAPCHGNALGADGTQEARRGTQGEPKEYVGHWPANIVHDGSDEVLDAFPTAPGQLAKAADGDSRRKDQNVYGAMTRGSNGAAPRIDIDKSAARFFYCAKASKSDRNDGLDGFSEQPSAASEFRPNHTEKAAAGENGNPYGRWAPLKNNHPTVKPTDLMRYLCRLITPPGGTVLDPFAGSGSTGRGAVLEGFKFIGIEMDEGYLRIANARIAAAEQRHLEEVFA